MSSQLAINGASPVRTTPFPRWPIAGDTEMTRLRDVLASDTWSSLGPQEREFEQAFGHFSGAAFAQCVSNGSVALELALRALGVGPGDEVIVPALTWTATAWAAVQVGATPVFADVGAHDWCLDPESLKQCLTPATRAVIPVHLYDQIANLDAVVEVASTHGLFVVEDCAHAQGATWRNQAVGTHGSLGTYSFQSGKTIACGEGGAVVTDDSGLADRIYALKDCGRARLDGGSAGFGANYRITEFQAAVLNAQLERLPTQLAIKLDNLKYFRDQLRSVRGVKLLDVKPEATDPHCYMAPLVFDSDEFEGISRDVFIAALYAEGIPIHHPYEPVYASQLWRPGATFLDLPDPTRQLGLDASCPVAEKISSKTGMVLPHQAFLGTRKDVDTIVDALSKVATHAGELTARKVRSNLLRGIKKLFTP